MSRVLRVLVLVALAYATGYAAFRAAQAERREADGQTYVIFPERGAGPALYLLWRPLSRLDERLTGMRTHIGPHRD